jgi:D-serine deaminase-like pyridoxal phosphate-dependent protein
MEGFMGGSSDAWYVVRNSAGIATPALLVYDERLRANIRRAIEIAGGPERLRPHVKTHKSARIVERMREAGIRRFKCATVAEAEMLGRVGVEDAMLAYTLVGENARRFARLCRAYPGTRFSTVVDSEEGAAELSLALGAEGASAEVLLDVDVGMHRTGVAGGEVARALYRRLAALPGIRPGGLHCYDGHNHERERAARDAIAAACHREATALRRALERDGFPVPVMVMGGTPSFPCYASYPDVELSPGTCFLHDWSYGRDLPDLPFQPAALVLSRVVSRPAPGRVTLDCGHKGIAPDQPGERGLPLNLPEARTILQNEEHWVLESPGAAGLRIGGELYILPTHICPTFAQYREVHVIDSTGEWIERWEVTARDRSIGI